MSNNAPAKKASASVLFGAAFLMATSAIGPGFLTQTSKFTAQYGAPLIMIVLCAIVMDITAQMNIWSVIGVSGMRAQDVANKMVPGLGVLLAILVSIGGLAFNVGNVGGVALGFNAMIGLPEKVGAVVAGCLGIIIFLNKNAKTIMDKVATVLAAVILITVLSVAIMVILDRLVRHNEQPQPDGTLRSTLAISNGKSLVYVWAIIIAWMVLLAGDGSSSFIYFQF